MASVKLMLNHSRQLKNGTYPLVFQLIHRRQKKLIYTKYRLSPDEFDPKNESLRYQSDNLRSAEEVRRINRNLRQLRQSIVRHIETLEERKAPYTTADIVFRYRMEFEGLSLLNYMDRQIARKQSQGHFGMAAALRNTRLSVATFIGFRIVRIADMNVHFTKGYEEFLQKRNLSHNTVCYYIRNLKTIYHQAILDGYKTADANPFAHIHSKPRKTIKRALDTAALRRMYETDLSLQPHVELARDLFLFSFFSRGMPFVDIIFLKKSNITEGIISYSRRKTNQWLQVSLTPQLKTLIRKYDNRSDYVFPILNGDDGWDTHRQYRVALERVNRNLKHVASTCGISTPLTTYVARHSWATLAKESGAPIAVISEGLGHSSEKMTRIYLREFDRRVVDLVNEKVSAMTSKL